MIPISKQLLPPQAILIDDIVQGMQAHPSKILNLTGSEYRKLISRLIEHNGTGCCYADFYYHHLDQPAQSAVLEVLSQEQQELLINMPAHQDVFYQLEMNDTAFIDILCKLNDTAVLFSTFYFTRVPCTLWGNYNMAYPIIWEGDEAEQLLASLLA